MQKQKLAHVKVKAKPMANCSCACALCLFLPRAPTRDRLHDVLCVPDTIVATGPCCLPEIPSFLESRRKNFFLPLTFGWPEWDVSICARSFRLFFDRLAVTSLATFAVQCAVCLCEMHPLPPTPLSTNRTEIDPILTHLQNGNVVKSSRHCLTVLLC